MEIACVGTNISSPLGWDTQHNYSAVREGRSSLKSYAGHPFLKEPFVASLFGCEEIEKRFSALCGGGNYTRFEKLAILSVKDALEQTAIDPSSGAVLFVLSSTKGNVELLPDGTSEDLLLGATAGKIAGYFGFTSTPVVISNACISGVCALISASRLLRTGRYSHAVVCGCDVLSEFIVSGFSSLKALSSRECKPFDEARDGLNLGEAAASIVLSTEYTADWKLGEGAITNDANHISGPSRTGEGSYRALLNVLGGNKRPSFINAHGTATRYNDEMESIAIERSGLGELPVNALKAHYGHTLGAAGILESILSMRSADEGIALGIRGYEKKGVSGNVSLSSEPVPVEGGSFVKLLSGFGGCNAALLFTKTGKAVVSQSLHLKELRRVSLSSQGKVSFGKTDGRQAENTDIFGQFKGGDFLTELYKTRIGAYPKFYKMDLLSRLAFVSSELLLEGISELDDASVIFFGTHGSELNDRRFQKSIAEIPSPALFVYTLPNISSGEVAIRHKIHGETIFYYMDKRDDDRMREIVESSCTESGKLMVAGWLDCAGENDFEAALALYETITNDNGRI